MTLDDVDKMDMRELRQVAFVSLKLSQYANLRARLIEDRGNVEIESELNRECAAIRQQLQLQKGDTHDEAAG